MVPSAEVNWSIYPLLHVSKLASLLDLPIPVADETSRLGWDLAAILEGWQEHLRLLRFVDVIRPTPSRGRTLRNLTVNVFNPIELLPRAWETGKFDWDPDLDEVLEAELETSEVLVDWADRRLFEWRRHMLEMDEQVAPSDRRVRSPRGTVSYAELLASQRWHAAFHYRQLRTFVKIEDLPAPALPYSLDGLGNLALPAEVF